MHPRTSNAIFAFLILAILWACPSKALAQSCHFKSACWTTATRPAAPTLNQTGLNTTLDGIEMWSGKTKVITATINQNGTSTCAGTVATLVDHGGTANNRLVASVPIVGGVLSGTVTIVDPGYYSSAPSNPMTVDAFNGSVSSGCSGATSLNITGTDNAWGLYAPVVNLKGSSTTPGALKLQGSINYSSIANGNGEDTAWIYLKTPSSISGVVKNADLVDGNTSPIHLSYSDSADVVTSGDGILNGVSIQVGYTGAKGTRQTFNTSNQIVGAPSYAGDPNTYNYQYVGGHFAVRSTVAGGGGDTTVTAVSINAAGSCTASGTVKLTGISGTGTKFWTTATAASGGSVSAVVSPPTGSGSYTAAPSTPDSVTALDPTTGATMCTGVTLNLTTTGTPVFGQPNYRTSLFGLNPHVRVEASVAKNYFLVTPQESDISVNTSASAASKVGHLIELTPGTTQVEQRGIYEDVGLEFGAFGNGATGTGPSGNVSWHYGISFGGYANNFPFDTDSTLIIAQQRGIGGTPTMNAKYGVDFSAVTFQATNSAPLRMPLQTPASGTEACDQGAVRWDASYFYACTSANVWKRAALYLFGGTYTAYGSGSATHTFQTATNVVRVIGCGAGGGGGSGAKQTSGSAASGGSGGGGGGCFDKTFLKSELGGTSMKVNVGTGGPGGGVPGAGPIKGNVGTAGSAATCISSAATCTGTIYAVGGFGGGGAGGQLAAASASGGGGCSYLATTTGSGTNTTNGATGADGTPGNPCFFGTAGVAGAVGTSTTTTGMGGAGGGGSNGAQGPIGSSMLTGASGGGAGGGIIAAGPSSAAGGNGGYVSTAAAGAAAGGAAGTNNGAGGVTPVSACMGATGGGGGGGNHAGNAGNGGNGTKGSGGGGGGSSLNANTPGTGGNGGDGFLCVYEYE